MITNLPSSEDFEKLAKNCLVQAFDIVFDTDKVIFDLGGRALKDNVWAYSQGKLNTAVVLIHQAIESFMKASVCETSPYLLLEGRRKDWPVLPEQGDRDFNDFYTTPAESLLRTYAATAKEALNPEVVAHIEAMRTLRNQIVHGISRTQLAPKKLVENVLDTFMYFLGQDAWWSATFSDLLSNPLSDYKGFGFEMAKFPERLEYVEALLGKAKFAKQFSRNTKGRRYYCPLCKGQWNTVMDDEYPYRWAFLSTSEENEPIVYCLNCSVENFIVREDCYYTNCKGSVRHYGDTPDEIICLTCGKIQYSGTEAEYRATLEPGEQRRMEYLGVLSPSVKDSEQLVKKSRKKPQAEK